VFVYPKDTDWIFASAKTQGRTLRVGNMLVRDYLYPAAVKAGVLRSEASSSQDRRGKEVTRLLFRPARPAGCPARLSQFPSQLVELPDDEEENRSMTTQRMLRQSNAAFTLERYTQTDMDKLIAAQELMLEAIFSGPESGYKLTLGKSLGKFGVDGYHLDGR
jgi:hypothetical protein